MSKDAYRMFLKLTVALGVAAVAFSVHTARAQTLKPVSAGLIDRQGFPDLDARITINTFVVRVKWTELQPSSFGEILADNPIQKAIDDVEHSPIADNAQIKVRVLAGDDAPLWAKTIAGAPVTLVNNADENGDEVTVGRFWKSAYQAAYADLQSKLAAKYDSEPLIADVTISGCMTVFAEPMIRQTGNAQNRENLLKAEYTKADDLICQTAAIQAHDAWKLTHSSLAANPYQFVNPNGSPGSSVPDALAILDDCRRILGARCVLENNSLRQEYISGSGNYQTLYAGMLQRGGPIVFQTATADKVGNLPAVLDWAVLKKVAAIELPREFPQLLTEQQITDYDRALTLNAEINSR